MKRGVQSCCRPRLIQGFTVTKGGARIATGAGARALAPERSEKDDVINSIARPGLESPRPSKTHARKTPTFSFLLLATGSGIQLPRHQIGRKLAVPALDHSLEVFEGFLDRGLE